MTKPKPLCGPKFLRGIEEPCNGFCCGRGVESKPDPELVENINRRAEAWRRITTSDE
jgi:hypothetical protein